MMVNLPDDLGHQLNEATTLLGLMSAILKPTGFENRSRRTALEKAALRLMIQHFPHVDDNTIIHCFTPGKRKTMAAIPVNPIGQKTVGAERD